MMINVLQLCAGKGSRFAHTHSMPKPFISIHGKPMFVEAFESMNCSTNNIRLHHLFQKSHIEEYNPSQYTNGIIHSIDYYTNGAATSANHVINSSEYKNEPWLIIDCDFIITHDFNKFLINSNNNLIFIESKKWDLGSSYSCVDSNFNVFGVAEKQPISNYRNTGQYYWTSGNLYEEAYNFYKENNILSNGEFYIAPLYNYIIQAGYTTKGHLVNDYQTIGTPDNLEIYLKKETTHEY